MNIVYLNFLGNKKPQQETSGKPTMGVAADYVSRTRIGAHFHSARESRKLILVIVAVALLLDNMLLTTVGEFFKFFLLFVEYVILQKN